METQNLFLQRIRQSVINQYPDAQIILFGSRVRNQATTNSDWDFLILLNTDAITSDIEKSVRHPLYRIEWETGQVISTLIKPANQWNSVRYQETELYKNIIDEGVII